MPPIKRTVKDQGWAWVVLAASACGNLLNGSLCYFVGVVHVGLLTKYNESVTLTAWVGGLYSSLMSLGAPLASLIIGRYGCRTCSVAGGILCFTGLSSSAFVTSIEQLFVTYGLIGGLGLCLCYPPTIVTIGFYFDKFRGLASGISLASTALGILAGNMIMQILIDEYSVSGAFLLAGAVSLHYSLFGMFYRPTEYEQGTVSFQVNEEDRLGFLVGSVHSLALRDDREAEENSAVPLLAAQYVVMLDDEVADGTVTSIAATSGEEGEDPTSPQELASKLQDQVAKQDSALAQDNARDTETKKKHAQDLSATQHLVTTQVLAAQDRVAGEDLVTERDLVTTGDPVTGQALVTAQDLIKTRDLSTQSLAQAEDPMMPQGLVTSQDLAQKQSSGENVVGRTPDVTEGTEHCEVTQKDSTNAGRSETRRAKGQPLLKHKQTFRSDRTDTAQNIEKSLYDDSDEDDCTHTKNSVREVSSNGSKQRLDSGMNHGQEASRSTLDAYRAVVSNVAFVFYCLSVLASNFTVSGVYLHLPKYAQSHGTEPRQAAALFVAVGVMSFVSRLAAGFATTDERIDPVTLNMGLYGLCGLATAFFPLYSDSYEGQMTYSALFGLYTGGLQTLYSTLIVHYVGVSLLNTAFGLVSLCMGIGFIAGPPLTALILDIGGSYEASFVFLGCMMEAAFFLGLAAGMFYQSENKAAVGEAANVDADLMDSALLTSPRPAKDVPC